VLALGLTPFHFGWMITTNPATSSWLRALEIDPAGIWSSLLLILAVPMTLGLLLNHRLPGTAAKVQRPLANFSLIALLAFIVLGLIRERHLLTAQILPQLGLVVLHNASGLTLGWVSAVAMRVPERDGRAVMIEGGMQNAGLALGIIAVQFNADPGMLLIASLWGIWHIVSGLTLAVLWRRKDARSVA
jgi:BASS family bile acid:Na+ symporter